LLTFAHTAWKSTSPPLFFGTFGKGTVEYLKISRWQLGSCQGKRIKRQQTVCSAGCNFMVPNASILLALMPSYCRFKPIECSYSESVYVSVPQVKIRGSAITRAGIESRSVEAAPCSDDQRTPRPSGGTLPLWVACERARKNMQKPRKRFHQSNEPRRLWQARPTRGLRGAFLSRYPACIECLAALHTAARCLNWEIHLGFLSRAGSVVVGHLLAVK